MRSDGDLEDRGDELAKEHEGFDVQGLDGFCACPGNHKYNASADSGVCGYGSSHASSVVDHSERSAAIAARSFVDAVARTRRGRTIDRRTFASLLTHAHPRTVRVLS